MSRPGRSLLPGAYDIKKIWNPSWFQGNRRYRNYFEGWYIKMVSREQDEAWALIPGISLNDKDKHAFVQVIDGIRGDTRYYRFPLEAFSYSRKGFFVKVGSNSFSSSSVEYCLEDNTGRIEGKASFSEHLSYRASLLRPGIMGWYRYVPFMECYHGVVSLDNKVEGYLVADGNKRVDFDPGRGYIEKDWGRSMPGSWVWMQSNHFEQKAVSFMLSVARIPWLGSSFTGFLGFLTLDGRRIDFATYTGARIDNIEKGDGFISIKISGSGFKLNILGKKVITGNSKGALKAPVRGEMSRVIHENLNSVIDIALTGKNGETIFQGSGKNAGLEIVE